MLQVTSSRGTEENKKAKGSLATRRSPSPVVMHTEIHTKTNSAPVNLQLNFGTPRTSSAPASVALERASAEALELAPGGRSSSPNLLAPELQNFAAAPEAVIASPKHTLPHTPPRWDQDLQQPQSFNLQSQRVSQDQAGQIANQAIQTQQLHAMNVELQNMLQTKEAQFQSFLSKHLEQINERYVANEIEKDQTFFKICLTFNMSSL